MRYCLTMLTALLLAGPLWGIGDADDQLQGKRWVERYPNRRPSRVYTGYERNGKVVLHGYDTYFYNKEGENKRLGINYQHGQKHGRYMAWYPNGQVKEEGVFREGERHGVWTFYAANSVKLQEVTYDRGRKHGPFKSWDSQGALEVERVYSDDEKDGIEKLYYSNGQLKAQLTWRQGTLHGKASSWYVNGQLKEELSFVAGKKDGTFREWYTDGVLKLLATYRQGVLDGPWQRYDETGQELENGVYKAGELWSGNFRELGDIPGVEWLNLYRQGEVIDGVLYRDGQLMTDTVQLWHINGSVQRQYEVVDGRRNGKEYWWYADGQMHKEMNWEDNQLQGPYAEWYPDGSPKWMVTMRQGKRHGVETRWSPRGIVICRGEYRDGKPWDGLFIVTTDDGEERLQKFEEGVPVETAPEDLRPVAPPAQLPPVEAAPGDAATPEDADAPAAE